MFHQGEKGIHGYMLFNLKEDIGEKINLAAKYPKRVKQMNLLIDIHLKDAKALVPIPNPDFDPAKYQPELIGVQPAKK